MFVTDGAGAVLCLLLTGLEVVVASAFGQASRKTAVDYQKQEALTSTHCNSTHFVRSQELLADSRGLHLHARTAATELPLRVGTFTIWLHTQ